MTKNNSLSPASGNLELALTCATYRGMGLPLGAKSFRPEVAALSSGPALIVSPHYDDAVLSCWHLLGSKTSAVLTVCSDAPAKPSSTEWDLLCGFKDSNDALSNREKENSEALAEWALTHQKSGLVDFAYRESERFSDLEKRILQSQVASWVASQNTAALVVALPVGAGRLRDPAESQGSAAMVSGAKQTISGQFLLLRLLKGLKHKLFVLASRRMMQHPDHLDARDSLFDFLLAEHRVSVVLYEELPYLWHKRGHAEVKRLLAENPDLVCKRARVKVNVADKFRAISKYKSQIVGLDPGLKRLSKQWFLPRFETYWVISNPSQH